ncbi:VirB4 family type IV secretion/conjugal transfer ATPase [Sphingorhabdus sp. IMCC26285]|uniref:Type IV secretion system protein virB4 n=1 Tax=Sphingorhabdus profundilacus TaxID=2509718 RepID=A0A6I4LZH5_9SPHN|nr:VirB4 family type IV secretion/conjugal transfer ATPase [Sphingorhabdus profundilacus]MVZ97466.1 VirB4 family type IV secretion/conjugal transfer ATPase [Sphingorhabdus profundilacus]
MKLSSQKLAKLDPRAGDRLPYAGHLNDHTLATRNGELIQMIQIDGIAFETADSETLNHMAAVRDVVMRGIANSNLMLYCHVIRRRVAAELTTPQPEGFARDLDAAWQERLRGKQLYINDIILMLVRRPARGKVGFVERLTKWGSGKRSPEEKLAEQARELRELDSARTNLLSALSRYGPRVLERYQGASGICSEPLEILSALYNGEMQPLLEPTGDAGHYLPYKRISFGLDALHLKGSSAETSRFGAIVSIKDYPATTSPGMLDNVLRLPHELTLTESFAFVDRQIADERIGLALRRLRAASDETTTLRQGLLGAKDELTGGAAAYGEHHLGVHVRAGSLPALDAAVADVQASLADIGAVSVREDLNLESAFWGQFPGNAEFIARKALVSTANLSGLISLHGFPIGAPAGGPWGEPITVLETTSSTPYFFNLHSGDLGNFTLIGPSGSGKTVVLNFLIAQSQKFNPRTFFFDKDRGAEIFIRAIGGHYDVLRPGNPTGFNPLQLPSNAANQAFLRQWLSQMLTPMGGQLTADENAIIASAVEANFDQPMEHRQLRYLVELLAGGARPVRGDLASRLAPWYGAGEHAWLFDNVRDELNLDTRTAGFDMTSLLDNPVLRTPAMMYLFHRVDERLDGTPSMIVIDEGWKALDDEIFVHRLKDWMKTIRKRNGVVGFATQSASDAIESKIAATIIEQSATQLFMSNPKAQASDYCDGFGLTEHELDLVRSLPEHLRCVLVKQSGNSVVARLDMGDMPDAMTVLSGRESSVRKLDELRDAHGDAPSDWMPQLLQAAEEGPSALWQNTRTGTRG